jgi:predicted enzyme related to lactoylglutathione lyase
MAMTVWALFPHNTDYLGASPAMVNYRVEDLDAMLQALASEGVWIDPKRKDHPYGRFAWIRDPEGNRIELWQPIGE